MRVSASLIDRRNCRAQSLEPPIGRAADRVRVSMQMMRLQEDVGMRQRAQAKKSKYGKGDGVRKDGWRAPIAGSGRGALWPKRVAAGSSRTKAGSRSELHSSAEENAGRRRHAESSHNGCTKWSPISRIKSPGCATAGCSHPGSDVLAEGIVIAERRAAIMPARKTAPTQRRSRPSPR
jgi:hypothetical protein